VSIARLTGSDSISQKPCHLCLSMGVAAARGGFGKTLLLRVPFVASSPFVWLPLTLRFFVGGAILNNGNARMSVT
jgi:hypothetical protein